MFPSTRVETQCNHSGILWRYTFFGQKLLCRMSFVTKFGNIWGHVRALVCGGLESIHPKVIDVKSYFFEATPPPTKQRQTHESKLKAKNTTSTNAEGALPSTQAHMVVKHAPGPAQGLLSSHVDQLQTENQARALFFVCRLRAFFPEQRFPFLPFLTQVHKRTAIQIIILRPIP